MTKVTSDSVFASELKDVVFIGKALHIDTVQGSLSANTVLKTLVERPEQQSLLFDDKCRAALSRLCYTRTSLIGLGVLLSFTSLMSLRNSQPSLGGDQQLSLFTWAGFFSLTWIGGLITGPIMRRMETPKWPLAISTLPFAIYPLLMFYPSYFTTLPVSIACGIGFVMCFASEGTYLQSLAILYSIAHGISLSDSVGRFKRVVLSCIYMSQVVGYLLTSLILGDYFDSEATDITMPTAEQTFSNITQCGLEYAYSRSIVPQSASLRKQYILFSVLATLSLTGWLILIFFVRPIPMVSSSKNTISHAFKSFLRMFKSIRALLIFPLGMNYGISGSLMLVDYIAAFVACPHGISQAGFVSMAGSLCLVVGSFGSGSIVGRTGRLPLFLIGLGVQIGCYLSLFCLSISSESIELSKYPSACLWAIGQGVVFTQSNGYLSSMFKDEVPAAINAFQTIYSACAVLASLSMALHWITLSIKVYVTIGVALTSALCCTLLETLLKFHII